MTNPSTGEPAGADALTVELEWSEAASGVDKTATLPDGREVPIRIPAGVSNGMLLRLPGADTANPEDPKDVFLRVLVKPAASAAPPAGPFAPPVPPGGFPAPPAPTSGIATSGFPGTPTSGFPATGAFSGPPPFPGAPGGPMGPGAAGAWQPAPPPPPAKKNGKIIGLVAGAVVLVLLLCGGAVFALAKTGGNNTKNTAAGASTVPHGASPSPAKPPLTPEAYAQVLATIDSSLTPLVGAITGARNPADLAKAYGDLTSGVTAQAEALADATPPKDVASLHQNMLTALGKLGDAISAGSSSAQSQDTCAGSSAIADLSSSDGANQVRTAAAAYAQANPAYKVGGFMPAASGQQNRRLGNGTFVKKGNRNGSGKLKVDNSGGTDDVAISVTPTGQKASSFIVYVTAGANYTVTGVPNGTYDIYIAGGADWDNGVFTRKCDFSKFADTFEFTSSSRQYTEWTITLKASVGGNAQTDDVPPGDFPTA
jgi:hypothetical protein